MAEQPENQTTILAATLLALFSHAASAQTVLQYDAPAAWSASPNSWVYPQGGIPRTVQFKCSDNRMVSIWGTRPSSDPCAMPMSVWTTTTPAQEPAK
jgi:hypothetical protein